MIDGKDLYLEVLSMEGMFPDSQGIINTNLETGKMLEDAINHISPSSLLCQIFKDALGVDARIVTRTRKLVRRLRNLLSRS